MDKKQDLISCLRYSKENQVLLEITSAYGKNFSIQVTELEEDMVLYLFSSGKEGKIRLTNIRECRFVNAEDREKYEEQQAALHFSRQEPGKRVRHFQQYYQEILTKLQHKQAEGSFEYGFYDFRIRTYTQMFTGILGKRENLLLSYLMGDGTHLEKGDLIKEPLLLLQQSNLSQKNAVKAALENRVSVIEGPPGTGKTTTIISIIANMVYRGQKVLIVSKNNSAIDNVAEELAAVNLPDFYIRMGNEKVMKGAGAELKGKLERYKQAIDELRDRNASISDLQDGNGGEDSVAKVNRKLKALEKKLNRLTAASNELYELKNQLKHLEKRREAYGFSRSEKRISRRVTRPETAKRKLDFLADLSVRLGRGEVPGLLRQFFLLIVYRELLSSFRTNGIFQILFLEETYLRLQIEEQEQMLGSENLDTLKRRIRDIYIKEYIPLSRKLIEDTLAAQFIPGSFASLYDIVGQAELSNKTEGIMKETKDRLMDIFPVVLTTVDAVLSNFYTNIKNDIPIDCVVIDEASQCDILSALPLLYLARRIVVVGDSKQLEAIKNLELEEIETEVEDGWDFVRESFLTTITKTLHPVSNMLLEHYRCDYNIINYCNKYFYDNQLLIYRTTTGHSMVLIDNDKGKYAEQEDGSFYNSREQETITQKVGDDVLHTFIITPFRKQGEKLSRRYGKQRCGTIHTFQGRGESEVWFSTVLNETQEAKRHLAGGHNLFSRELINVAVSRAKDRFTMVADVDFFKKYDENVAALIEYIETYGERIPDKTVCLFDYLYRQMPVYHAVGTIDNPFEESLWKFLQSYLPELGHFECSMKLPLAAVVTDGDYLTQNPDIKRYIENHAHLDYLIYDTRINRPALAIELDGKYHKEKVQMERDQKKDEALRHMGIPLWRIRSKEAWTEAQLQESLNQYLKFQPAVNEDIEE